MLECLATFHTKLGRPTVVISHYKFYIPVDSQHFAHVCNKESDSRLISTVALSSFFWLLTHLYTCKFHNLELIDQ